MKPNIPLARPYFDSEESSEVQKVLSSGWVTRGKQVGELEKKIAGYLGIKYAVTLINCTSALHLALLSLGIKKGDEVLVSDYSFPATALAVLYCGAKPRFVDISPITYNIDPSKIEKKITKKTKAIIPVHAFGYPAEMNSIIKIASKHGLMVIEDAACALGAKYKKKFAGTIGDIGCFSLHGRKGITTGEGGIAVTNNKALAEKIMSLSTYGADKGPIPRFTRVGYNYKMSDITASIGLSQLKKLRSIIKKKNQLAKCWNSELKDAKFIKTPSNNILCMQFF